MRRQSMQAWEGLWSQCRSLLPVWGSGPLAAKLLLDQMVCGFRRHRVCDCQRIDTVQPKCIKALDSRLNAGNVAQGRASCPG